MADWIYLVMITFILKSHSLVRSADTTYMKNTIRDYFSDTRHHEVNAAYKNRSKTFIHDEFERFGLETEYHTFVDNNGSSFENVIGILKGKNFGTQHDKIIGVCAHYDTVSNTKGVDDNGSGVAAMLVVAKQIFARKLDHTLIFLSPDMEEDGLMGSEKFIADWIPAWFEKHYKDVMHSLKPYGFVVLDTVMEYNTTSNSQAFPNQQTLQMVFPEAINSIESDKYQGDFITLIYRKTPDLELAQSFAKAWKPDIRKQFELEEFPLPVTTASDPLWSSFHDFYRSDHYNFWTSNMTAIFLTDSANFRGNMIDCYHNPCDNIDVMLTDENIAFLGKTADAIVSTILHLNPVTDTSGGTRVAMEFSLVLSVLVIVLKNI